MNESVHTSPLHRLVKLWFGAVWLAIAVACSTEPPPRQDTGSFTDTESARVVTPERSPAADKETEPDSGTTRLRTMAERPPSGPRAARVFHRGPRGGCYTYTSTGRKQYVDHSFCR